MTNRQLDIKYSPFAWWLTSSSYFGGDVLVLGVLPIDDIYYLCSIAKRVFYLYESTILNSELSNLYIINVTQLQAHKYNAIIIGPDNVTENPMNDYGIDGCLAQNGVVTQYSVVGNGILKGAYNLLSKIIKTLYVKHASNSDDSTLVVMPCVSYDLLPYEAFIRRNYHTNKNINMFKEMAKSYLYNSIFCDYFINSYVSVLYKKRSDYLFEDLVTNNDLFKRYGGLIFTKVYYKYGKLILSYISRLNSEKYIVVISLDKSAIYQRENEGNTINFLKNHSVLSNYVVKNYMPFKYCGLSCVFMDEVNGITMDAYCSKFLEVSKNVYDVIKNIGVNTKTSMTSLGYKADLIKEYITEFSLKLPGVEYLSVIDIDHIVNNLCDVPMVLLHGDSKIENYVVNKDYVVSKIIDLELSEIISFPLLDLIYFIIYNLQIEKTCDFLDAYDCVLSRNISKNYSEMLFDYINEFSLSEKHTKALFGVFILHHYARRVVFTDGVSGNYLDKVNNYLIQAFTKDERDK